MTASRFLFATIQLVLVALMAAPLLLSEMKIWWLDNLISLQLQWSLLALLSIFLGMKCCKGSAFVLIPLYAVLTIVNFSALYFPPGKLAGKAASLKVAQLNLSYENPRVEEIFLDFLDADYDILVIQEISDRMASKVGKLNPVYPYAIGSYSPGGYSSGQVLLSKWPIIDRKVHNLGYVDGRVIEASIAAPGGGEPIHILVLHPGSPRNAALWELRNSTLDFVARRVSSLPGQRQIVIGDLNVTPWSPFHNRLLRETGLQNSASGHGYIPSWSLVSRYELFRLLSSAYLDHCLVSAAFVTDDKRYRYIRGSDHALITTHLRMH